MTTCSHLDVVLARVRMCHPRACLGKLLTGAVTGLLTREGKKERGLLTGEARAPLKKRVGAHTPPHVASALSARVPGVSAYVPGVSTDERQMPFRS